MNKLAYVILVNYYRMVEIDILVDIFSYVVEIALFYSSTDILFMCLDCTASREKNAVICCGMRNSSIVNRRAPLSSRVLRMSLATFSGSCFVPVQQVTNTCKYYAH